MKKIDNSEKNSLINKYSNPQPYTISSYDSSSIFILYFLTLSILLIILAVLLSFIKSNGINETSPSVDDK